MKKKPDRHFQTMEKYREYYSAKKPTDKKAGNRYYKIGEAIAQMACEKAMATMSLENG